MACGVTLKRHHEFEPLLSPAHSPKRHCLPGDILHSPLRRMTPSPPGATLAEAAQEFANDQSRMSPRGGLSCNSLDQVCADPVSLNCLPVTNVFSLSRRLTIGTDLPSTSVYKRGGSVPACTDTHTGRKSSGSKDDAEADVPLLTLSQVSSVCQQLVEEHTEKWRGEMDKVLNAKLAAQYESFVNFNQELLKTRFRNADASYVS